MDALELTPQPGEIDYQDENYPDIRTGWQIEDLGALGWALERLGEIQGEIAQIDALRLQAIARIEARAATLAARAKAGGAFLESAVFSYMNRARKELLGGGKKKSRSLPTGTIGWRAKAAQIVMVDEAAAMEWAKSQPVEDDILRVKLEINKKILNDRFKATGEVPPGFDIAPEEETPYVKAEVPALALVTAPAALKGV